MTVSHNLVAMNAQRQFNIVGKKKAKSTEKLSSGYKINRAADDAAGLAISEKMRRQIRGLTQGIENTQDGISMCQVADGALNEVNDMLHRITELSVKSANGTNTAQDRQYIQKEVSQLLTEIDRISEETEFNEIPIFKDGNVNAADGTQGTTAIDTRKPWELSDEEIWNQLIKGTFPTVEDEVELLGSTAAPLSAENANRMVLGISNYAIANEIYHKEYSYPDDADILQTMYMQAHDNTVALVHDTHIYDEVQSRLATAKTHLEAGFENSNNNNEFDKASDSYYSLHWIEGYGLPSPITRTVGEGLERMAISLNYGYRSDSLRSAQSSFAVIPSNLLTNEQSFRGELAELVSGLGEASAAFYGDIADRQDKAIAIYRYLFKNVTGQEETSTDDSEVADEEEKRGWWIQSGAEPHTGMTLEIDAMNTSILGIKGLNVSTVSGANRAIDAIKDALTKVMENRSKIGAQQNRLEHTIKNESNIVENTQAAESAIRDTDMAKEMVQASMLDILQQAGISMMSQANQSNQGVLSLL